MACPHTIHSYVPHSSLYTDIYKPERQADKRPFKTFSLRWYENLANYGHYLTPDLGLRAKSSEQLSMVTKD